MSVPLTQALGPRELHMRASILLILLLLVPNTLQASAGEIEVLGMLKSNSIVQAAVAQAQKFSGAKECEYSVTITDPQPGADSEYRAEIVCSSTDPEDEGAGVIRVSGLTGEDGLEGMDAFTLEIAFAG